MWKMKDEEQGSAIRAGLLISATINVHSSRMGIDDMLRLHAGEFGRWQLDHFVLTCTAWALVAFQTMVMIFADRQPPWRCLSGIDYCPPEPCGIPASAWEWVIGAAASTVSEWGLICGQRYKIGLAQSAFFGGCILGAGVFGHLSDSFLGRKGSLAVVCILNTISGVLTSLSPSYSLYASLRLLTGFGTGGIGICAFSLATEPIGPSKRGVAGMSTFYFFTVGVVILSGIAYLFPTWRSLYAVTSIPSLLFLLILPFVSESPRWYLIRHRTDDAMSIMRDITRRNGRVLPPGVSLKLDDEEDGSEHGKKELEAESGSIIDVVRSPTTRLRLILVIGINFVMAIVYYGLSLNVVNLKTNLYLNVLLNSVSEMPAYVITALLLDRFGRKPLGLATMGLSGLSCSIGFMVGGDGMMKMVCGMVGIFGMAAMYNLLFIYTAELFPTVVRNTALGCATQVYQLGAILAPPLVVAMASDRLPFALFGACGFAGALMTYYLPETMNMPLHDTMTGMENAEALSDHVMCH